MIPREKIESIVLKHKNIEKDLSSGNIDPKTYAQKSKEYSELGSIIKHANEYLNFDSNKKDLEQILNDENATSSEQEIAYIIHRLKYRPRQADKETLKRILE